MRSDPFIEALLGDTAGSLRIAHRRCDGIRGVIYLFLCRAYEARLPSDTVCNLLGIDGDCVLNRAGLDSREEEEALDAFAVYDSVVQKRYGAAHTLPLPDATGIVPLKRMHGGPFVSRWEGLM
jgi:hypothetical protein